MTRLRIIDLDNALDMGTYEADTDAGALARMVKRHGMDGAKFAPDGDYMGGYLVFEDDPLPGDMS